MDVLTEIETERVPARLRPFLFQQRASSRDEQTWRYFAYGYSRAFEELTNEALRLWPGGDYLRLPLFYLCRHSLELALKTAIKEYSLHTTINADLEGHRIHDLWNRLLQQMVAAGYPAVDDEWTAYCGKLVRHLHDIDPDGERFRYPVNKAGNAFEYTRVEIEELAKAQWNVFSYCEVVVSILQESDP